MKAFVLGFSEKNRGEKLLFATVFAYISSFFAKKLCCVSKNSVNLLSKSAKTLWQKFK
jgi:hypothetical protein